MRQGLVRVLGGAAMMAVLAGAAACNSSTTNTSSGNSYCGHELAYFGALTGSSANLGVNIEQGAELAIDQFNDQNGANCVTWKKFDSQGDPAVAPGVALQLVADKKIIGVVGPPFSGESTVADPDFNQAGIPFITPSATNPALATNGWKTFHRAVANDDDQGPAAANYIKSVLNAQKVFVADDTSTYGAGLAKEVKDTLGSLVVATDETQADGKQQDFSSTVTKIKSSGATVFFYGGYYTNAGLLRKQLTAAGWTGTLVSGDGSDDPGLAAAAGNAAAAGTIVTCPCSPTAKDANGKFASDYKAKWNVDAGTYSDVAYDATNIFLQGIKAGKTTAADLNTYLSTVDYKGIANEYKFTSTGELDPSLIKVWAYKFDANGQPQADQVAPSS